MRARPLPLHTAAADFGWIAEALGCFKIPNFFTLSIKRMHETLNVGKKK